MKILIVGAKGQLGSDLCSVLSGEDLIPLDHSDLEICDGDSVSEVLEEKHPDAVINTAAFHKVDDCEDQVAESFSVNAVGVSHLAKACAEQDCVLVHLSTDYVFSGAKGSSYEETDPADPINVYGASKLAGEHIVRYRAPKHFVVRTSGLFGVAGSSGKGGNFIELMVRLAKEGKDIKVVNDQILSPTPTADLARQIEALLHTDAYGLYHATSQGQCTWFDFAAKIFEMAGLSPSLAPTTSQAFGAKALRPSYSVLENAALQRIELDLMREWDAGLADYLRAKGHI